MDISNNEKSQKVPTRLAAIYCPIPSNKQGDIDHALRTYATWLLRAARRKLAGSGAENTPIIDLTSGGNKCTNSLVDNDIGGG